jgi:hypothetical protein
MIQTDQDEEVEVEVHDTTMTFQAVRILFEQYPITLRVMPQTVVEHVAENPGYDIAGYPQIYYSPITGRQFHCESVDAFTAFQRIYEDGLFRAFTIELDAQKVPLTCQGMKVVTEDYTAPYQLSTNNKIPDPREHILQVLKARQLHETVQRLVRHQIQQQGFGGTQSQAMRSNIVSVCFWISFCFRVIRISKCPCFLF